MAAFDWLPTWLLVSLLSGGETVTPLTFADLPPVTVPVVKLLFAAPLGQPLHFVEA
jgi:hypothetical protein